MKKVSLKVFCVMIIISCIFISSCMYSEYEKNDKYDNYVPADKQLYFLKTGKPVAKSTDAFANWQRCKTIVGVPKEMFMIGYKMFYNQKIIIQNPKYEPDVFFIDWNIKSIQVVKSGINSKGEMELRSLFVNITDAEILDKFKKAVLLEEFEEFNSLGKDDESTVEGSEDTRFEDSQDNKNYIRPEDVPVQLMVTFEEYENIV